MVGDARVEARVGLEEGGHALFVAGQDHDQVAALVFHGLQEHLDGLLAVVPLVLGPIEIVGLVDEEHAADGLLEHLLGLGRRVAHILAHQVVARGHHQVALAHIAQVVQDARHAHGDGGLARAGLAGEAHVQGGRLGAQAHGLAQPRHQQQAGDLADARLDRRQPDQVAVQLVEQFLDVGLAIGVVQIDQRLLETCVSGMA